MEEFTQSVKATLYDRAKKPFTGTFILAWIAYNWKILVAIFFINEEHLKGITRIEYIEKLQLLGINNLVLKPFGIAVLAIILFGILNIIASWIVLQFKNFQFTYVDKRTKVDAADHGKLLDELRNIKENWAKEIQSINMDRSKLIESNGEYEMVNESLERELKAEKEQLNDHKDSIKESTSYIKSYESALAKASELLEGYSSTHGSIEQDKTIEKIMNAAYKTIPIDEIVKYIDRLHDNYKS